MSDLAKSLFSEYQKEHQKALTEQAEISRRVAEEHKPLYALFIRVVQLLEWEIRDLDFFDEHGSKGFWKSTYHVEGWRHTPETSDGNFAWMMTQELPSKKSYWHSIKCSNGKVQLATNGLFVATFEQGDDPVEIAKFSMQSIFKTELCKPKDTSIYTEEKIRKLICFLEIIERYYDRFFAGLVENEEELIMFRRYEVRNSLAILRFLPSNIDAQKFSAFASIIDFLREGDFVPHYSTNFLNKKQGTIMEEADANRKKMERYINFCKNKLLGTERPPIIEIEEDEFFYTFLRMYVYHDKFDLLLS